MKIGIIGAGQLGTALAKRLASAGYEIMLSYTRDDNKLAETVAQLGVLWNDPLTTVAIADVVALTVPWIAIEDALATCGSLNGKIVWDCTNALKPNFSGLAIGTTTSAAETIAAQATGARVVKGIPPFAELLHSDNPLINGNPASVFICGDDAEAKLIVKPLLEALPADVVDAGPLENARYIEPAGFLLVRLAYGLGYGSRIGLQLVRDETKM